MSSEPTNEYVIDVEDPAETARLLEQDRLVSMKMTEPWLPNSLQATEPLHILDLACGPGGWVLGVAERYRGCQIVGIDISTKMIEYARGMAKIQRLSNTHFEVANVLGSLQNLALGQFDFINARFLVGIMQPNHWAGLLHECQQLLRPGGMLRLTEGEFPITSSPALSRLNALLADAFFRAQRSFSSDGRSLGITAYLAPLLREAGYGQIRLVASALESSYGTELHQPAYHDMRVIFSLVKTFLLDTGVCTAQELDQYYECMLQEMLKPSYYAYSSLLSAEGRFYMK